MASVGGRRGRWETILRIPAGRCEYQMRVTEVDGVAHTLKLLLPQQHC